MLSDKHNHFQKEVASLNINYIVDSLKFLKILAPQIINFVTHEKRIKILSKEHTITILDNKATLYSALSKITNLDSSDFVYNIHQVLNNNTSLEDFSKQIYYAWKISAIKTIYLQKL